MCLSNISKEDTQNSFSGQEKSLAPKSKDKRKKQSATDGEIKLLV